MEYNMCHEGASHRAVYCSNAFFKNVGSPCRNVSDKCSRLPCFSDKLDSICTAQVIDYGPKNYTHLMQQACQEPAGPWRPYAPNENFPVALEYLESIREASLVPGLVAVEATIEGQSIAPVGQRRCLAAPLINSTDFMPLGSVGKAMTATLVAYLIEDGTLTWDTTIGEIFADKGSIINKQHSAVTVRMLASQHSGISNNTRWNDAYFWNNEVRGVTTEERRDSYLDWALAQSPANPANTTFLYSNINYIVLGAIVDRWRGTWETVIQDKLFKPLSMVCGFGPAPQRGYRDDEIENPWPHLPHYDWSTSEPDAVDDWKRDAFNLLGSAGNIYCDARSYAAFAGLHLNALLECPTAAAAWPAGTAARPAGASYLSCDSYKILHTPHSEHSNMLYTAGGWYYWQGDLWHDGTNNYNHAYSYISLTYRKAYLAFTNMGDDEGKVAVNRVMNAFLEGDLDLAADVAPCSSYMPAVTSWIPRFEEHTLANGDVTMESIDTRTVIPDVSTPVGLPIAACTASRTRSASAVPTKDEVSSCLSIHRDVRFVTIWAVSNFFYLYKDVSNELLKPDRNR